MRKLGLVLASLLLMLVAGLLAYKAEATPMLPSIPQSSPVETVACGGPGPTARPAGRGSAVQPAAGARREAVITAPIGVRAPTIVLGAGATEPRHIEAAYWRPLSRRARSKSRVPFALPHHLLGDALGDDAI